MHEEFEFIYGYLCEVVTYIIWVFNGYSVFGSPQLKQYL